VQCTKISPEFECQGQRSKVKAAEDKKNEKVRHFVWESSSGARFSCGSFSGAVLGALLRRWENQRMLSSSYLCSCCYVPLCIFIADWRIICKQRQMIDSLYVGEQVGDDAVEQFEIVHQKLRHVHVTDCTKRDQLLRTYRPRRHTPPNHSPKYENKVSTNISIY